MIARKKTSRGNPQSSSVKCEQEGMLLALAPTCGRRDPVFAEQHEEGMTSSSVLICMAHHRRLSVWREGACQTSPGKTTDDTFLNKDDYDVALDGKWGRCWGNSRGKQHLYTGNHGNQGSPRNHCLTEAEHHHRRRTETVTGISAATVAMRKALLRMYCSA